MRLFFVALVFLEIHGRIAPYHFRGVPREVTFSEASPKSQPCQTSGTPQERAAPLKMATPDPRKEPQAGKKRNKESGFHSDAQWISMGKQGHPFWLLEFEGEPKSPKRKLTKGRNPRANGFSLFPPISEPEKTKKEMRWILSTCGQEPTVGLEEGLQRAPALHLLLLRSLHG